MSSPDVSPLTNRPRAVAIVIAGFIGFLAGQVLALLLIALGAALAHYPGGLGAIGRSLAPPWWANATGLVGVWCGFAAAIFYAYREGRLSPWPHQWRPRRSDVGYVVLGVAAQFVIDAAYAPFHFKSLSRPVNHLFQSAHGLGFALVALLTTFVAPFFEEWLFRGVIFRAVAEGTPGSRRRAVALAVVASAALFALAHGEPLQFFGLFALGALLALVAWRTRRLVPSYLAHASFNAVALVAVVAQRASHS